MKIFKKLLLWWLRTLVTQTSPWQIHPTQYEQTQDTTSKARVITNTCTTLLKALTLLFGLSFPVFFTSDILALIVFLRILENASLRRLWACKNKPFMFKELDYSTIFWLLAKRFKVRHVFTYKTQWHKKSQWPSYNRQFLIQSNHLCSCSTE